MTSKSRAFYAILFFSDFFLPPVFSYGRLFMTFNFSKDLSKNSDHPIDNQDIHYL